MAVIGTAGHVDHGKSTLIAALTGRDPDRWKEEKERGLTIDLGFGWMPIDGGREISFVDVPGHERFIKNMLAGVETIDAALFVVAADAGWMPQSEEHLAVLDLLDTRRAIVALTKIDLVDQDLVELAALEIDERLAGTSLADAPLVPVSAATGAGLEALRAQLAHLAREIEETRPEGQPRLWVDRSFSISGAGTVVTGSLVGGSLEVGADVEVWPAGVVGRIRTLHRHETDVAAVSPGSRCAVNISGLERTDVERGSLLAPPGTIVPTSDWLTSISTARYVDEPLTSRGAYHLHLGSGVWPVRLRPLSPTGILGTGMAMLRPDAPVPVRVGDRFILREVGRRSVVAGGRIMDPESSPRRATAAKMAEHLTGIFAMDPDEAATLLLEAKGVANPHHLEIWTGGRPAAAFSTPSMAIASGFLDELRTRAISLVEQFHEENPLREGYPKASLASQLGVALPVLAAILTDTEHLRDDGSSVAAASFNAGLSDVQEASWTKLYDTLASSGWTPPRLRDLAIERELLHVLLREGRIVRISEEFVYLPESIDSIVSELSTLSERFTVAEFRDALELSRKYAVPVLEFLDAQGITRRDGDTRTVRSTT